MTTTLDLVRRITAILVIAGIAVFGSVAVAPAASADDGRTTVVQPGDVVGEIGGDDDSDDDSDDADDDEAPAPPSTGSACTADKLERFAKDQATWTKQAAVLSSLAKKSKVGAEAVRVQAKNLKPTQKKNAEALAKGMDTLAEALERQALELLDKAKFGLECTVEGAPRF